MVYESGGILAAERTVTIAEQESPPGTERRLLCVFQILEKTPKNDAFEALYLKYLLNKIHNCLYNDSKDLKVTVNNCRGKG